MNTPDNTKSICPVDDEPCDGCAGVRAPCDDAVGTIAEECSKCIEAAPVILPIIPKLMPFTVPTCGIANTDPMNMTKANFEAWFACLTDGPEKDAIRAKRTAKEEWARKELAKLNQPVRRTYFGANGPTGHGDICQSDADPGL